MFRKPLLAAVLVAGFGTSALAADKYVLDPSHSQVIFSYNHLGYSTSYGMFSGFGGAVMLDVDTPANSSVTVSMKVMDMITGWDKRKGHFMSPDFFDATDASMVNFTSTNVEVTGDSTTLITGDLTMNGVTKSVVLDTKLNKLGVHPRTEKDHAGFFATTMLKRSDFNLGKFAPAISDEVELQISVEMSKES